MYIGDVLVAQGLVTPDDLIAGLRDQRSRGGSIGDRLVELGRLSQGDLDTVMEAGPKPPRTIADTEVPPATLVNLVVKAIYMASADTPSAIAAILNLPMNVVLELVEETETRQLIAVVGAVRADVTSERCYALTRNGVDWAQDIIRRSEYLGPAPVSLEEFRRQIGHQLISTERSSQEAIAAAFKDLVVSEELFTKLGPAINSARSILLYGPPGNGKTTIAEKIGGLFKEVVYIPHCFEVDGQIIKVFDPIVHRPVSSVTPESTDALRRDSDLRQVRDHFDQRWVACRRPVIVVGGELSLEMLELGFNEIAKFYEAPLHIKAMGGVFLIDDFGRQLVSPKALLNRWITPLESRRDHLTLTSGKSFALPFDELVLFATNITPHDLMDAAFLRRIPYKIEVTPPSPEAFTEIFERVSREMGVEAPPHIIRHVIAEISERNSFPLAGYQPKFIVEQVRSACRFAHQPFEYHMDYVDMALSNLHAKGAPGYDTPGKAPAKAKLREA